MSLSSSKPWTFEHTMTPSGASQNNLKPPARKLWQSREQLGKAGPPQKYRNSGKDKWDNIHCPQFIDLANLPNFPETGDSFFGKHKMIVSTPKGNIKTGSSTHSFNENTQIESLNTFPLPEINIVTPEKEGQNAEDRSERTVEQYVNNVIPMETNEPKNRLEVNTPQKNDTSTARFHSRDESKQDNKPEPIKKNLEEDKNSWIFREKENNLKSSARRFCKSKELQHRKARPPQKYRNSGEDKVDEIVCPQFVDFANFPETGDSFFGKHKVIVSTPKVNTTSGSSTHSYNENTLIESLNAFFLSGIDIVTPEKEGQNAEDINEESIEQSVDSVTVIQVETKEPKNRVEVNKPLNIATSTARYHGRDGGKQDNKPERIKKNLEEDKNPWVFRAKPVPKYLIARKMEINKNNNSAEKMDCEVIEKKQKLQCPDKNKKNTEVWKKPPCPAQQNTCKPKSPPLRTKERAEERKRFNQAMKMNETKAQLQRKMELEAKKEQEEKETALLRKQTVHKAQPIRKYKSSTPTIKKRMLTDPKTPNVLKKRRVESHK